MIERQILVLLLVAVLLDKFVFPLKMFYQSAYVIIFEICNQSSWILGAKCL